MILEIKSMLPFPGNSQKLNDPFYKLHFLKFWNYIKPFNNTVHFIHPSAIVFSISDRFRNLIND